MNDIAEKTKAKIIYTQAKINEFTLFYNKQIRESILGATKAYGYSFHSTDINYDINKEIYTAKVTMKRTKDRSASNVINFLNTLYDVAKFKNYNLVDIEYDYDTIFDTNNIYISLIYKDK